MGNMKKKSSLFLLIVTCYLLLVGVAYAATPSATDNEIKDQLIENIASRVAELKLVEKRGIVGEVSDVSNTQITISDIQGNTRFIDVDELTKFSSPSAKGSFGISDITKGITIGALGLYNKESRRLLARFVNVVTLPTFVYATIDSIDNKNFMLNTTTNDKKTLIIDIQNTTKISSYSKETAITRSTFSKISEKDSIVVRGFAVESNQNMIVASSIITLTDFRPKEESVPATESGKTSPITR